MYGKVKYKNQEIAACCTRPDYAEAYIMHKMFKAVVCKNCGGLTGVIGNRFIEWVFKFFFAPFWDGAVWVPKEQISEQEIKRVKDFNRF